MPVFHLTLLGTFDLRIDGKSITDFRSDRARALLAYMATEAGQVHRREELAALFWPDLPEAPARANLRNVLSNLRAIFNATDDDNPLRITRHDVSLRAGPPQVDLLAFTDLLAQAQRTPVTQIELLQKAAAYYAGDFLAGLSLEDTLAFQEWRMLRQERYHHQAMEILERIATHFAAAEEYERLAESARQQLRLTPWHEPAHRRLIQSLAARGMRAGALEQYDRCVAVLAEELGVEPDAETQTLARRIRGEEERAGAQKDEAAPRQRSNIPLVTTSFLGRESNLTTLLGYCQPGQERLVTLLGIGGVGKSRLAAAVGQQMQTQYRDGVCWVSLEGVQPSDHVANRLAVAIAAGLDLALGGPASVTEQVLGYLAPRQLLLVLDNFEQIVADAGFLLTILAAAPQLSVIVTSRQRLNLPGERTLRVSGLDPQAGAALFVSRAEATFTDFSPDIENREAIERICGLVEGLPLGIELAAVWTEHFTCEEIAAAIEEDWAFLARKGSGEQASGERHDSLRTVYEHSWQLLPQNERRVLAQLSVFQGEFSRAAFLSIVETSLSELSGLLAKSLVHLVGAGRYTTHEVVRAFSAEKFALVSPTEKATVLSRYQTYYLHRLQDQPVLVLQQELENIRAAWLSAVTTNERVLLTEAAARCADLMQAMGLLQDGMALLTNALDAAALQAEKGEPVARQLTAALLVKIGGFAKLTASLDECLQAARRGLLYTDDPRLRALLYNNIARALAETKNWQEVDIAHQQFIVEARRSGDRLLLAQALSQRAGDRALHFVGDYTESIGEMEQALALATEELERGSPEAAKAEHLLFTILGGLAIGAIRYGDYVQSLAYGERLRALAEEKNERFEQIEAFVYLGQASCFARRHQDAIAYATQGLTLAEAIGDREGIGLLRTNLCLIHRNAGNFAQAVAYGESALPVVQALENRRMEGLCRTRLGHALLAQRRSAEAAAMYALALAVWDETDNPNRYEALAGRAVALHQVGQEEEAEQTVREVLGFAVGEALGRVTEPLQMLGHCAQVLIQRGDSQGAADALDQARFWGEHIAARNNDPSVRSAYLQNIPATNNWGSSFGSRMVEVAGPPRSSFDISPQIE